MKRIIVILMSFLFLSSTVIADPMKTCSMPGELIGDDINKSVYYECSSDLTPIQYMCVAGMIFNLVLRICDYFFPSNPDGEYCRCKSVGGSYGCYSGNRISTRPECSCSTRSC